MPREESAEMLETEKFDRRPFTVNAIQVTQDNAEAVAKWCGGVLEMIDYKMLGVHAKLPAIKIEGTGTETGKKFTAVLGMWIVQRKSSFRTYKHNTFKALFVKQDRGINLPPGGTVDEILDMPSKTVDVRMHGFATSPAVLPEELQEKLVLEDPPFMLDAWVRVIGENSQHQGITGFVKALDGKTGEIDVYIDQFGACVKYLANELEAYSPL
jgi:hypothetical protein